MNYAARSDTELLSDYAQSRSEEAFEFIVERHIDLVHAEAMWEVHDEHLAWDVAQAVFVVLARRAGKIHKDSVLVGWLLLTTRNVSRNAVKQAWRLKRREQGAAAMKSERSTEFDPSTLAQAREIMPFLDGALEKLGAPDRDAIVLRYILSMSYREVGRALGIPEDTATKRVTRALEKLRAILGRQGITASDVALSALWGIAIRPAPAGLVDAVRQSLTSTPPNVQALAKGTVGASHTTAVLVSLLATIVFVGAGVWYAGGFLTPPPVTAPTLAPTLTSSLASQFVPNVTGRTITFFVVDPLTRQPLTSASAQIADDRLLADPNDKPLTPIGADGKLVVTVPNNFKLLRLNIRAPGRVPMRFSFDNSMLRGELPPSYTVPMEIGVPIGGLILDDFGQPVPGALVELFQSPHAATEVAVASIDGDSVLTDIDGKWRYDEAPAKDGNVYILVNARGFAESSKPVKPRYDDLLHQSFTYTIKRAAAGDTVRGVVLSADGIPVSGAKVVAADDKYDRSKRSSLTDADGRFTLEGIDPHVELLTIIAPGYAPALWKIEPADERKPVEVRLDKGKVLEGRVVTADGKPVEKAIVEVERWRGKRVLQWSVATDRNGYFKWTGAPSDAVQISVVSTDYSIIDNAVVTAGEKPARLTLYPPLHIVGNVIDADSKAPIPEFRMILGIRQNDHQDVTWQTQWARTIAKGHYDADIRYFSSGGKLYVDAEGYLPAVSRMIEVSEGSIVIDFELKKGTSPKGVVVDADGQPVEGAQVVCLPEGTLFTYHIGEDRDDFSGRVDISGAKTDKAGRFTLRPQAKHYELIVLAEQGFAHVHADEASSEENRIRLIGWSRIVGNYRAHGAPVKNANVFVSVECLPRLPGAINLTQDVVTDSEGRFVSDHLPSSEARLYEVQANSNSPVYRPIGACATTAGKTVSVTLDRESALPPTTEPN